MPSSVKPPTLSPNTLLQPAPDAVSTPIEDGQTVVLHLSHQTYYELNPTATSLWDALAQGRASSLTALADLLAGEPGAPDTPALRRDVDAFVRDLLRAELLVCPEH